MADDSELVRLAVELFERRMPRVMPDAEAWSCHGEIVTNGMFGVPKLTTPDMQIEECGVDEDKQRLIAHLLPSDSLQEQLEDDVGTLHYCGPCDATHPMVYELFVESERDSFCDFYVYFLPDLW